MDNKGVYTSRTEQKMRNILSNHNIIMNRVPKDKCRLFTRNEKIQIKLYTIGQDFSKDMIIKITQINRSKVLDISRFFILGIKIIKFFVQEG